MLQLNLLLLAQAVLGVGLILLLQKIGKMKKQMDEITKEVKNYLSYIMDSEEENGGEHRESKNSDDEVQNSIIQAVLGEIFP